MIHHNNKKKNAFTLVEIMIVVAIIGLLAALAIPGFVKARKQSQGRSIVENARMIDAAMDQVAMEKGLKDGSPIDLGDLYSYLKHTGDIPSGVQFAEDTSIIDMLKNPYYIGMVGPGQVQINSLTKSALQGVGIDWGSY